MRLLIISNNAVSKTANNGKTLRSLLKGIPSSDIIQFYTGTNEYPDVETCSSFYRVTESQILKSVLNLSFKTSNSHIKHLKDIQGLEANEIRDSQAVSKLKHNVRYLGLIRETLWASHTWDTAELNQWINDFKPTAIFAILGNCIFIHHIALTLSKRYNLPLNVFFTDDYVVNDSSTNLLAHIHYKLLCRQYTQTLKKADKAFVIGESMRRAYALKYNREFGILINGIDFTGYDKSRTPLTLSPDKPIIVSFIGGIHLNRWKSISKLGKILSKIKPYTFEIRVYCVIKPDNDILKEFEMSGVNYCGSLKPSEISDAIDSSHILLHVESFDKANRLYTKFSVSTKIPEYLSSNRGIIAFGPHEIASIEIFSENNLGCSITDLDSEKDIESKIRNYIENYNNIDFKRQYSFAYSHFNKEDMLLKKVLVDKSPVHHN